ncbi:protein FAM71A-like [Choloepus didactylus]|uniref:protein FAM71A-like n=1 Tax=Choloepus didactylus TaxID=27675 RepID=UPI0018A121D3|nr:protein FAM71A-like [Choloepus didactylus]
MKRDCHLPYYTAQSGSAMGIFNTTMGRLQRQLHEGEYEIFKYAPVFESDFMQVTKRGEAVDMHNRVQMVTVGIVCTSPMLPLPDVMLLAQPATSCKEQAARDTKRRGRRASKAVELTRLVPLKFVRISVHNREKQQLHLKFATGRSYYLQLCPPRNAREDLFTYWEELMYLLRPPVEGISNTHAVPADDMICMPVSQEEDRRSTASADFFGNVDQDQVSIRSLHMESEVFGASSAAFTGGEGIKYTSQKPTSTPDVSTPKPAQPAIGAASGAAAGAAAKGSSARARGVTAPKSTASDDINAAIAGAAAKGPERSGSSMAISGVTNDPSVSVKVAVAGAASQTSENASSTAVSTTFCPESSMSVAIEEATSANKTVATTAQDSAVGPPAPILLSEGHKTGQEASQRVSQTNAEARKPKRERRERRAKHRATGRESSRPPRAGERNKTKAPKMGSKLLGWFLASRRSTRVDQKVKSRGSPGGSRRASTQRSSSRTPSTKESRASQKSGRSLSTGSRGSVNSRLRRISSFLRNVKASLVRKSAASPRGTEVAMHKAVERSSMEVILETVESDRAVTIGAVTAETVESVTLEARETAADGNCKEDQGLGEHPHTAHSKPSSMQLT